MNPDETTRAAAEKMARRLRMVGWWFLIIGLIVSIQPVAALFDPQAIIQVDGLSTSDFATKLGIAVFALIFPALGAFFAFTPKDRMGRRLMAWIAWSKRFVSGDD
jgi:hypothetical protein